MPAASRTVRLTWCTPSVVIDGGAGQAPDGIPEEASVQVNVTVTVSARCQPAAFAAGATCAVMDGADAVELDRAGRRGRAAERVGDGPGDRGRAFGRHDDRRGAAGGVERRGAGLAGERDRRGRGVGPARRGTVALIVGAGVEVDGGDGDRLVPGLVDDVAVR